MGDTTYNNFRPGYMERGEPLGATRKSVMLIADNTQVSLAGVSYLELSSDNTTAANRTFTLIQSTLVGHWINIVFISGSSTTCQLADSGTVKLVAAWQPSQYDSLSLMWNGSFWIEMGRSSAGGSTDIPLAENYIFVGNSSGLAAGVAMSGDISIAAGGATAIAPGAIVNADVNASAAIAYSKLNLATSILNADISASAAIAFSKLATLTSGNILVGSAGNVATSVAMSGDATMVASGAVTIANDAITTVKILNSNVTLAKLASGITPSHVVKFAGQLTSVGGAAAEAFAVAGLAATDLVFCQVKDDGTAGVTILQAVPTTDTLTVTFSANPGNDTVIYYQALRAAS